MAVRAYPHAIEYYVTEGGDKPFKKWLERLRDVRARAKVRVRLDRARLGNLGDHRPVGDGVTEMRIDYGPGYRVYFVMEGKRLILLLLGGEKGTQERDIAKAKEYWQDHRRRRK